MPTCPRQAQGLSGEWNSTMESSSAFTELVSTSKKKRPIKKLFFFKNWPLWDNDGDIEKYNDLIWSHSNQAENPKQAKTLKL